MTKLTDLCSVACHLNQPSFVIPPPGASRNQFVFASERRRVFYAIQPRNHDTSAGAERDFNPAVAIVGLSPAATQVDDFVNEYRWTKSYDRAARSCSFKGLARHIIEMLEATGAARQLDLRFCHRDSFDAHPDVLTDSLVKCASMSDDGDSTDWKPGEFEVAKHCVLKRFLPTMLSPAYTRLKTILVLGDKGWKAINDKNISTSTGQTVHAVLHAAGKRVLWFPHPSGQNGEYVKLAKQHAFPAKQSFVDAQYAKYVRDKTSKGRPMKKTEADYKAKAGTVWTAISQLRKEFERAP